MVSSNMPFASRCDMHGSIRKKEQTKGIKFLYSLYSVYTIPIGRLAPLLLFVHAYFRCALKKKLLGVSFGLGVRLMQRFCFCFCLFLSVLLLLHPVGNNRTI